MPSIAQSFQPFTGKVTSPCMLQNLEWDDKPQKYKQSKFKNSTDIRTYLEITIACKCNLELKQNKRCILLFSNFLIATRYRVYNEISPAFLHNHIIRY